MKSSTRSYYREAVARAVEAIAQGLDAALDLEQLAREAATSPFHFHRIFRGLLGETPLELHRRLRLERAAWALVTTDDAVSRIAFDAGYETHASFTRAFRKAFERSPQEFRTGAEVGDAEVGGRATGGDEARCGAGGSPRCIITARSRVHMTEDGVSWPGFSTETGGSAMKVELRQMDAMRIATVEHRGAYHKISEAFTRLGQLAGPAGLFGPGTRTLGLYYDDPESTAEADLRSEAAVSVSDGARIPEGLNEKAIPSGTYAVALHEGSYQTLGDTWSELMGGWLPESDYRVTGVPFECYLNMPGSVPDEELRTELYIPVERG